MKQIIAILASMLVIGSACAASVSLEDQFQSGDNGAADSHNYSVTVKESVTKHITADIGATQYVSPTDSLSTRAEVGGTYSKSIDKIGLYTRVAVGNKFTGSTDFGYYSVESGVTTVVGSGVSAKLGYRYRTAFDNTISDKTNTVRATVAYDLTKKDQIGVRYDKQYGDSQSHTVNLIYTRGF